MLYVFSMYAQYLAGMFPLLLDIAMKVRGHQILVNLSPAHPTVFASANHRNQTYVYSNTKFPILVKKANQKVGKCILHIIAEPVRPPSMLPMMHEWYAEYVAKHPEVAKADAERAKLVAQAQAEKAKAAGLPVPKANATEPAAASHAGNTTAASPAPNSAAGVQTAAGLLLGAAAMVAML